MYEINEKLPNILEGCTTIEMWEGKRKEILDFFAENEYGKRPNMEYDVSWNEEVRELIKELDAIHVKVNISVQTSIGGYSFPVSGFIPLRANKVQASILICSQMRSVKPMKLPEEMSGKSLAELKSTVGKMFEKFEIVMEHPETMVFMMNGLLQNNPTPLNMDKDYDNGHWPVREMLNQGMAMFGFYATDVECDEASEFPDGLAKIFGTEKERNQNEWGALGVWAFAASCVMNYVQTIEEVDGAKVSVVGHSRCGKAALWCGANDERFAAVMPNGSGCCGAALSRGKTGENLASIQAFFPHWFAPNFRQYAGKEETLPYDQHYLLAAVAPRILHVGSGSEDDWADPKGEHYSTVMASEVWKLYGGEKLESEMPGENETVMTGNIGYHLRKGPHKLDTYDWYCLCNHMKQIFSDQ